MSLFYRDRPRRQAPIARGGTEKLRLIAVSDRLNPFSPGELTIDAVFEARPTDAGAGNERNEKTFAVGVSVEMESFSVKLSADPQGRVSVKVARRSGDADIRIAGAPLTLEFDSTNWDAYQTVELTASEDSDEANGAAVIRCSAPGVESKEITATELDTGRRGGGGCSSAGQAGAENSFSACVLPTAFLVLAVSLLRSRKRGRMTANAVDRSRH